MNKLVASGFDTRLIHKADAYNNDVKEAVVTWLYSTIGSVYRKGRGGVGRLPKCCLIEVVKYLI